MSGQSLVPAARKPLDPARVHPSIGLIDVQVELQCGVHAMNNVVGEQIARFDYKNRHRAYLDWKELLVHGEEEIVDCPVLNAAYVLLSDDELLKEKGRRLDNNEDGATCFQCNAEVTRVRCLNCTRTFMEQDRHDEVRSSAAKKARKAAEEAVQKKGGTGLTTEEIIQIAAEAAAQRALEEVTSQREVQSVNALFSASKDSAGGPGAVKKSRRTRNNQSFNYRPLAQKRGNLSDEGLNRLLTAVGLFYQCRAVRTPFTHHNPQIFTSTVLRYAQIQRGFLGIIVYTTGGHYIAFKYAGGEDYGAEYVFLDSASVVKPVEEDKKKKRYANGCIYSPSEVFKWVNAHSFRSAGDGTNRKESGMVWLVSLRQLRKILVAKDDYGLTKGQLAKYRQYQKHGARASAKRKITGGEGAQVLATGDELVGGGEAKSFSEWVDHAAFEAGEDHA